MRYRALDANGDYTFGVGGTNFLVDSPECVQQAVLTALKLWQGEFFLNTAAGVPWLGDVIGYGTKDLYDAAIQQAILGVQGVTSITSYSSTFDESSRSLTVEVSLDTAYGATTVNTQFVAGDFVAPLTGGYGVGGYAVRGYGQ